MNLRRENDIEQLRRIALTQKVQIEQLLRVLELECQELRALKGSEDELQRTLELLNRVTRDALDADAALAALSTTSPPKKERKPRTVRGPTAQPQERGIVVRQRVDAHGDRIAVDAAGPGCLLPLRMSLGAEASAGYAASRLVVCVYPHEDLESELASPATLRDLFELQRHALNRLERIVAARGCAATVDQVESLLEALLESIAPLREGDPRPVDLAQRDIAALLRLRPETVCRALRTLQDRGSVARSPDVWMVRRAG